MPNAQDNRKTPFDRRFERQMNNSHSIAEELSSSLYGGEIKDEVTDLQNRFNTVMKSEIEELTGIKNGDTTAFINRLYFKDQNNKSLGDLLNKEFDGLDLEGSDRSVNAFMTEAYKNRILKQEDIHQVATQLIELKEAVSTTRDAVVSPDINTGRINREINFGNNATDDNRDFYTGTIESMEERFDLHKKIKDFAVYNTLEQGWYYAYTIPYAEIFNDFLKRKDSYRSTRLFAAHESAEEKEKITAEYRLTADKKDTSVFLESCVEHYITESGFEDEYKQGKERKELRDDIEALLDRVTVNNDPIPIPVLEEGIESIEAYRLEYVNESGDMYTEEKAKKNNDFVTYMKQPKASEGIYGENKKKPQKVEEIKDCYIKMCSGREMIPIKLMKETVGYLYVKTEDCGAINGKVSSRLASMRYDPSVNEHTIIDDIAGRIIDQLDNKFIKNNPSFRKIIAEAINYYDLNERRVFFQFVPKEYVFRFTINEDEDGEGQSMLEDSLFYAKLYLILLLFKIMVILTRSTDQKINYVKQSGIDKEMVNNVQDIIRDRQARKINITDLFNYTGLLNKLGVGAETYVPVGPKNEHAIDSEILSGQQVDLNTPLMELLRNSYILGTGVPSAIMNYLNEADFAKSLEVANTKFNGRVINYQLDLNPDITRWYRALMRWTTNIPDSVINEINIILPLPKTPQNNINSEMIGNFTTISEFLVKMYFGEEVSEEEKESVKIFTRNIARTLLPGINFDKIDEIFQESLKTSVGEQLKPKKEDDLEAELSNL